MSEAGMDERVNHPSHYGGDTTYETIKVIEAWNLGFHLGNAVKYISRAGKKGSELEDIRKAAWYLQRHLSNLEGRCASASGALNGTSQSSVNRMVEHASAGAVRNADSPLGEIYTERAAASTSANT